METKPGPKPTKQVFGFMDESGLLTAPGERVFALGLIILQHPTELHKKIMEFKSKRNIRTEFKSTDIANKNINIYKELIDMYFSVNFTHFSVMVFDRNTIDIKKYHKNDQHHAYNSFTAKLISGSLDVSEYITVIADDVTTPKDDNFEKQVKDKVKLKLRRNALFGIVRAESHAFTLLQMADVLIGLVAFAFKIKYKQINPDNKNPKLRVLKYLQNKLNEPILSKTLERRLSYGRIFKVREVVFTPKK